LDLRFPVQGRLPVRKAPTHTRITTRPRVKAKAV